MTLPLDPIEREKYIQKMREIHAGKKQSEETKQKRSASLKGIPKGPMSEETKRKLSEAHKGILLGRKRGPMSEETKQKLSESHKGKGVGRKMPPRSEEWYRKQRESHLGKSTGPRPPRTDEWRRKQSESHMGHKDSDETRKKKSESLSGLEKTTEHRTKIGDGNRGEKSGQWKGGVTPLKILIRMSAKMIAWRAHVFERDNYTCQSSGIRGIPLEAHHKISFSELMEKHNIVTFEQAMSCDALWDLNNGITLSKDIHRALHSSLANGKEDDFE